MINQIQLLFLLLLTRSYIPNGVVNAIIGSKFALFPYYVIPTKSTSLSTQAIKWFDYDQDNSQLSLVGLESGSSLVNNYSFLCTIAMIIFLHIFLYISLRILVVIERKEIWKCFLKALKWPISKVLKILTFGYYIRTILETYQFFLLWGITEINNFNLTTRQFISSFVFAVWLVIWWLAYLGVTMYFIYKTKEEEPRGESKLEEMFNGLKHQRMKRYYMILLLLRRIVFVSLLICATFISPIVLVCLLWAIQIAYFVVIIILRSFIEIKDNIIEITNEVFFLFFLGCLGYFNEESRWKSTITNAYIYMLTANNFAVLGIVIVRNYQILFNL